MYEGVFSPQIIFYLFNNLFIFVLSQHCGILSKKKPHLITQNFKVSNFHVVWNSQHKKVKKKSINRIQWATYWT